MKKTFIIFGILCLALTTFAGPRDGRGRGHDRHGGHGRHHDRKHEDLYVANGILDLVGKGLNILRGPRPVVVATPVVTTPVVTTPVVQPVVVPQPVVVQQPAVQPTTTIIQVGQTKYLIYTDANGRRTATPIE